MLRHARAARAHVGWRVLVGASHMGEQVAMPHSGIHSRVWMSRAQHGLFQGFKECCSAEMEKT